MICEFRQLFCTFSFTVLTTLSHHPKSRIYFQTKWVKFSNINSFGSLGEFFGPFLSSGLELSPVCLVELGNFWHQGVIGVGIGQQRRNGEQHLRNGQGRRPLVLQDVQADRPIRIDVGVVDLGREVALGRPEGVVGREVDIQEEDSSGIWAILRPDDGGLPVEVVAVDGSG